MKESIRSESRIDRSEYLFYDFGGFGTGNTNRPDAALTGRRDYRGNCVIPDYGLFFFIEIYLMTSTSGCVGFLKRICSTNEKSEKQVQ